jgi:hypothetical protein
MKFQFLVGDPAIDFLKEDLDWPFSIDSTNDLAAVSGEENIESALLARGIVAKREIPHRPLYGAFEEKFENAPADGTTFAEQRANLLAQYNRESRVTGVRVNVEESSDGSGKVVAVVHAGVRTGVAIGPLEVPLG